jgi:putative endonuclease
MYFVYVLKSEENGRFYIGSSENPDRRLDEHNSGKVKSTKSFRPWKRIFLEEHSSRSDAIRREKYLKSGWGRKVLAKLI